MSTPTESKNYDPNNIFARMLRQELDYEKVYEDAYVLAIQDKYPKAPVHVLVLPKGAYTSSFDFHQRASDQDIVGYYRGIDKTLGVLGLTDTAGYRLQSNAGQKGGQEVFHFHTHILSNTP